MKVSQEGLHHRWLWSQRHQHQCKCCTAFSVTENALVSGLLRIRSSSLSLRSIRAGLTQIPARSLLRHNPADPSDNSESTRCIGRVCLRKRATGRTYSACVATIARATMQRSRHAAARAMMTGRVRCAARRLISGVCGVLVNFPGPLNTPWRGKPYIASLAPDQCDNPAVDQHQCLRWGPLTFLLDVR